LAESISTSKKKAVKSAKESFDTVFERHNDELTDIFGKKWSVSYKITDKERLDKDELKDLAVIWNLFGSLDKPPKLQDGYYLEIDLTVKGKDDEETMEIETNVLKYKGKWYFDQNIFSDLDF
jgi:hypothetical protein